MSIEIAETTLLGTRWPVLATADGVSVLDHRDGELLDPARCDAGAAQRGGEWHLARTVNGIVVVGTYPDSGAWVRVYIARSDARPGERAVFPEVQATYVVRDERLLARLDEALPSHRLAPEELGVLDTYGHTAMGPVPVIPAWLPEHLGNNAELILIGGGFLTFEDSAACCRMLLQPLPWRVFSPERAAATVQHSHTADLELDTRSASVWTCRLSDTGCSYAAPHTIGALWSDALGQSWHLQYRFDGAHGAETERRLRACARGA